MDMKPLWVVVALTGMTGAALAQATNEALESPAIDCSKIQENENLGNLFEGEAFGDRLKELDACMTEFIETVQRELSNDPNSDATQAFDELDAALSARITLFRTVGDRFRVGSAFADSARQIGLELDLRETDIASRERNGDDVTADREKLAKDRVRYEDQITLMQQTRETFSTVISDINTFRPTLARQLRDRKFDTLLAGLAAINEAGGALATTASDQIQDFINAQTDTRQGQN